MTDDFGNAIAPRGVTLSAVSDYAAGVAVRAADRAGYAVTGFVLTDKTRGAKCIVDGREAAWLPADESKKLLAWKRPKQEAPPEWVDEAPPTDDVSEGELALQALATHLGIPYNTSVPHNAGWFVPGIPNAFPDAGAAVEALFDLIYTAPDATVYRPGKGGRASGIVITGNVTFTGDIFPASPAMHHAITDAGMAMAQAVMEPAPRAPKSSPKPAPVELDSPQVSLF